MAPTFRHIDSFHTASIGGTGAENEIEAAKNIIISVDLVAAARKQLHFLKAVGNMPFLHHGPLVLQAIRRYKQFWMPLAAELGQSQTLLPPLDVQWVWHCHLSNPDAYHRYCVSRFSRMVDRPLLLDSKSEGDALHRCRKIWSERFPSEPLYLRVKPRPGSDSAVVHPLNGSSESKADDDDFDLVDAISTQSALYQQQCFQPFMWENAFLVSAKERYKCFLHLVNKYNEIFKAFVPTSDIILMWTAHQNSPVDYARDVEWLDGVFEGAAIAQGQNNMSEKDLHETARLWENTYGKPYEKAGATFEFILSIVPLAISKALGEFNNPKPMYWEYQETNVNIRHETLEPRYVMEVCILIKGIPNAHKNEEFKNLYLRLQALDSYKRLRSDKPLAKLPKATGWQNLWTLQCEVSTKGLALELRSSMGTSCISPLGRSRRLDKQVFLWNEMLQDPSLSIDKTVTAKSNILTLNSSTDHYPQIQIITSITPAIQAPYLLKCVPDRVTDDSGAMLSDFVLRMNKSRPQEGRWISRTVLNHAGKECFVVRIRVARGTWRRSGDRPVGVDWNERVIQICEGAWNYVSDHIGIAPAKVVGTATPTADELEQHKMTWSLSSGEIFTIQMPIQQIQWERHLEFTLKNTPKGKSARLLNGRKLQYQVTGANPEEEEGFVTLVRYTAQCPQGKATALFNWKVSAMEFLPEEDAVLILLLCNATVRTVADFGCDNLGNFFIRRRIKEAKPRSRDWGSVVIQNSPWMADLTFWYLNPREVLGLPPIDEQALPLNSEEQTHVYRNGSWLYMDAAAATMKSPYYNNSAIRKVSSSANALGIGVAEEAEMEPYRRSFSGVPEDRHRRPSSSYTNSKYSDLNET